MEGNGFAYRKHVSSLPTHGGKQAFALKLGEFLPSAPLSTAMNRNLGAFLIRHMWISPLSDFPRMVSFSSAYLKRSYQFIPQGERRVRQLQQEIRVIHRGHYSTIYVSLLPRIIIPTYLFCQYNVDHVGNDG